MIDPDDGGGGEVMADRIRGHIRQAEVNDTLLEAGDYVRALNEARVEQPKEELGPDGLWGEGHVFGIRQPRPPSRGAIA